MSITLARLALLCINMGARSRIISHLGTWDYFGRSRSHRLRIANWELVHLGATEAPDLEWRRGRDGRRRKGTEGERRDSGAADQTRRARAGKLPRPRARRVLGG